MKAPATRQGICEIHKRFGDLLPDNLLWEEDPESGERTQVIPGELRSRDVKVGSHIPVSAGALPRFLDRFEQVYSRLKRLRLSFLRPPRIIVYFGFTRTLTVMAA